MRYVRIVIAMIFIAGIAFAEVDESRYIKDTVPVENTYACQVGNESACELPILLNKANKKVEYYWSDADNKWLGVGDKQAAFQKLYRDREDIRIQRQMKRTQEEMNRRLRESMEYEMKDSQGRK